MNNWRLVHYLFEPLIFAALVGFIAVIMAVSDEYKYPDLVWRLLLYLGLAIVVFGVIRLIRFLFRR